MSKESTSSSDDAENNNVTKTLRVSVLKVYFEGSVKTFLDNLINQSIDKAKAANLLYATINFSEEDFLASLKENFTDEQRQDPRYQRLITKLTTISQLCRGAIEEKIEEKNDPFFRECREVVAVKDLSNEDLKKEIGKYFKDKSNIFLVAQSAVYVQLARQNTQDHSQTPLR
ncbi:MAG: hypothetical protein V4612_00765 [Pseudomonadota bacterium]